MADPVNVEFKFNDSQIDAFRYYMKQYSDRVSVRPVMVRIGAFLRYQMRDNWDSGGSHAGEPWAPLSKEWLKRKIREGSDTRILHRFGRLRRAVINKYGSGHLEKPSNRGLEFGIQPSHDTYKVAAYLKSGRHSKKGSATPRSPLKVPANTSKMIGKMLMDYVHEGKLPDYGELW